MAKRRRKNPSIKPAAIAMAGLGGLAVAAAAYALDGTSLSRAVVGAIELAIAAIVGTGVSMASPTIGAGIVGGGVATGGYALATELLDGMAQPAASTESTSTNALRANLNRVRRANQLGAAHNTGAVVTPASRFAAIRHRMRTT